VMRLIRPVMASSRVDWTAFRARIEAVVLHIPLSEVGESYGDIRS
jgi:hypothetical protein